MRDSAMALFATLKAGALGTTSARSSDAVNYRRMGFPFPECS